MKKRRTETNDESWIEQYKKALKSLSLKPYEGKAKKIERYFQTFSTATFLMKGKLKKQNGIFRHSARQL